MEIANLRGLLFYEVSIMRDAERAARLLLDLLAGKAQNERLAQLLRKAAADSERHLSCLDECLGSASIAVLDNRSDVVEGIHNRYQEFLAQQPAGATVDGFTAVTAVWLLDFCLAGYRSAVNWAHLIGEEKCVQPLQTSREEKEQTAREMGQLSQDVVEQQVSTPS